MAFSGCTALETITGTVNVKFVAEYAFSNCQALEVVYVATDATFNDADYKANGTVSVDYEGQTYQANKYTRA